jgi:hypothetical protein
VRDKVAASKGMRMMDNPSLEKNDHIWTGTFTDGQHSLKVMGCLEAC